MFGPKLTPFKSVECLVIREFEMIKKATLLSLPRLGELRYNASYKHLCDLESYRFQLALLN